MFSCQCKTGYRPVQHCEASVRGQGFVGLLVSGLHGTPVADFLWHVHLQFEWIYALPAEGLRSTPWRFLEAWAFVADFQLQLGLCVPWRLLLLLLLIFLRLIQYLGSVGCLLNA